MRLFQSHAGSIEADKPTVAEFAMLVFQSHAGSIEAGIIGLNNPLRHRRFNPTLVRLRLCGRGRRIRKSGLVSIPRWFD